ncbi:MAG: ribosomal protein S18-alanine N-acetyltransferase, partial [Methanomassiliicoccales archaeon]
KKLSGIDDMIQLLKLRRFSITDLREVYDLACTELRERYSPDLFLNIHSYWPDGFIIAEESGKVLGFILGLNITKIEARILMLVVRRDLRRKGLGTMLLNEFRSVCAVSGIRCISLEVRKSNLVAINLYKKLGFEISGEISGYYSDGESAYKMQLFL